MQNWITHNSNRTDARPAVCRKHACVSVDCYDCREQRFVGGCKHPAVKHGARMFWHATLRCAATLVKNASHPVRVTIANAYKAANSWPGTRRIAADKDASLPMRLISNGHMEPGEVASGWNPIDISRLHQKHHADIRLLLRDPKYASLRRVHSCRRAIASLVHYWHSCIEILRGTAHESVPAAIYKSKHMLRLKLISSHDLSSRELHTLAEQLAAQMPIQVPRKDLRRCLVNRILQDIV